MGVVAVAVLSGCGNSLFPSQDSDLEAYFKKLEYEKTADRVRSIDSASQGTSRVVPQDTRIKYDYVTFDYFRKESRKSLDEILNGFANDYWQFKQAITEEVGVLYILIFQRMKSLPP